MISIWRIILLFSCWAVHLTHASVDVDQDEEENSPLLIDSGSDTISGELKD
jgi:hypothetical protein